MIIQKLKNKRTQQLFLLVFVTVLIITGIIITNVKVKRSPNTSNSITSEPKTPKPVIEEPSFDKKMYSTSDPSSLWVVVNKQHSLNPIDYTPTDLITISGATISQKVQSDFEALMNDAHNANIFPTIVSSYRSYATQSMIYNNYAASYGETQTDTFSARPGFSEHQLGLAIDFGSNTTSCNLDECFGNTNEGKWLAENASKYGFLLRYTGEKQSITGYKSEPWHFRYIGKELAEEMKTQNITTLEEFFSVNGGEQYVNHIA